MKISLITFFLINCFLFASRYVEKIQKKLFKVPSENRYFQITSVEKDVSDSTARVSFSITAAQSGNYLIMPEMSPCYKLSFFNNEDYKEKETLPIVNLKENIPNMFTLMFSRECLEPPNNFKLGISPRNSGINFDGGKRVVFSGQSKDLKDLAWLSRQDKSAIYIYVSSFDF